MNQLEARYQAEFQKHRDAGLVGGLEQGLRIAIADLCELLEVNLTRAQRASLDVDALEALRAHLKEQHSWPGKGAARGTPAG